MRIVQVSPYDLSRHGGVQQHVHSLAAELRRRGHDVLLIGPGRGTGGDGNMYTLGAARRVSVLGTSFEITLASRSELRALSDRLAAFRPDVMHYHTMWVPLLPWQIFRQTPVPAVATFHDTPPPGFSGVVMRIVFKLLSRYLLSRLDGAIAVSPAPLGHLRPAARGIKPVVLPPATDLSDFFAVRKEPPSGRKTALFFGRLEPRKGVDVLLDAWSRISSGAVPLPRGLAMPQLIIAGNGELEPMVRKAQHRLGAQVLQHVPAPSRTALLRLLAEADIAISPATYGESFGIVLAEALASGTPVIGAANAGYVHVLTGPGRALLVPPGDADALAREALVLLGDDEVRFALAGWGRAHARQFDVATAAPAFEKVYAEALARGRSKSDAVGRM
ncbi:MAG: glycosyltransferase family 4 protein [Rhizobiales bacterium]|nr:glycosyltransferase family 4 protein [Hyphomicrobiales bacterium]